MQRTIAGENNKRMFESDHTLSKETLMKFHHILAAGLASLALLGTPAQAEPRKVTIAVHFDDLDLRDPAQVRALHKRVEAAAKEACAYPDALSFNPVPYDRACKASLVESAEEVIARKRTARLASAS